MRKDETRAQVEKAPDLALIVMQNGVSTIMAERKENNH
jgi:hypothetical protein